MKKRILKLYILIVSIVTIILGMNNYSYGKAVTNDPTIESGGTVNITISTTTAVSSFKIQLSSNSGLIFQSVTRNSIFIGNTNGTTINGASAEGSSKTLATYTFKVPEVTETRKYTVEFFITGMDNESNTTTTSTVTVTPKTNQGGQTGGNTGSSTGGNNGGTTTNKPTVTEPKFTSTNKTVYATSDINLRSSWSTSSSATKIAKGTELKLTGTSTEKVNGYVWYRVTYNGQTKYVSKDLITENKPEEKANNNLKILKIEGVELTPEFNANVTEYSIQLTNYKENELKILAEAEDNKSTVKIEGNTNLKLGENVITITVTAEDGTKKVYTITATKEDKEALGLKSLVIKDVELKDFSTDKFEYEIEFEALEKLDIEAIPNMEGATVEILGNENLVDGENTITIIVTSADGEQTATYQIKANRLIQSKQEENRELNIKSLLICGLIALVVLVIIIILIIKYVKNNDNSNIDYVYNDNLNNEQNENNSQDNEHAKEEEIEENEKKQEEIQVEETSNQVRKSKVDELFDNYEEETQKKKGRGKHSK